MQEKSLAVTVVDKGKATEEENEEEEGMHEKMPHEDDNLLKEVMDYSS